MLLSLLPGEDRRLRLDLKPESTFSDVLLWGDVQVLAVWGHLPITDWRQPHLGMHGGLGRACGCDRCPYVCRQVSRPLWVPRESRRQS